MHKVEQPYHEILTKYPETISKEQLCKICGVSKRTAEHYLAHGLIPCQDSGMKTRRYTIRTADVVVFLNRRDQRPYEFAAPIGWYKEDRPDKYRSRTHSVAMQTRLKQALSSILSSYPDLLKVADIHEVMGYDQETILRWCRKQKIESFFIHKAYMIPKSTLFEFLTADCCYAINEHAKKHILSVYELKNCTEKTTKSKKNGGKRK